MYFGNISEELLLCVLDAKTGKLNSRNYDLSLALIGGLLMELILQGKLTIAENKVILIDDHSTEDGLLNEILKEIRVVDGDHSTYYWIRVLQQKFSQIGETILNRLIEKGILRIETHKLFWIINQDRYFIQNFNVKDLIRNNIVRVVIDEEESDHRTLALLSLLRAINCECEVFTQEELESSIDTIINLTASDEIGKSISNAINNTAEALMRSLILTTTY